MGKASSRLTTIWAECLRGRIPPQNLLVDGGFDGVPFMMWVMDICRWIVQVVLRPEQTIMFRVAQKTVDSGTDIGLADGVSAIGQQTLSHCQQLRRHLSTLP